MKKTLTLLTLMITIIGLVFAQAPQSFKYQAIARDANGNILADKSINLRINLLSGGADGEVVYTETHQYKTNAFGLISLDIGSGEVTDGDFSQIDWGRSEHYVQVEMDAGGGTNYNTMGASQLLSVPYALYAAESGNSGRTGEWTSSVGSVYLVSGQIDKNLGIGLTDPGAKLHVVTDAQTDLFVEGDHNTNDKIGRIRIINTPDGDKFNMALRKNSGNTELVMSAYSSSNGWLAFNYLNLDTRKFEMRDGIGNVSFQNDGLFEFYNNGDVIFSNSGNVGVATTSTSTYKLNVGGEINATNFYKDGDEMIGGVWEELGSKGGDIRYEGGNVGIGSGTPLYTLQVGGTFDANMVYSGGKRLQPRLWEVSPSKGTDIYYTAGNVGINESDPEELLHVEGRLLLGPTTAPGVVTDKLYNVGGTLYWNGTDLTAGGGTDDQTLAEVYGEAGNTVALDGTGSNIRFRSFVGGSWRELLYLEQGTGYVGMGTTLPHSKLEVIKYFTIGSDPSVNQYELVGQISFYNNDAVKQEIGAIRYTNSNNTWWDSDINKMDAEMTFHTMEDATVYEAMRIDYSRNVGIGSIDPGTKLDVNGTIRATTYIGDGSNLSGISAPGDNLGNHSATQILDMNSNKITEVSTPTAGSDAANKSYVDSHAGGDNLGNHLATQVLNMDNFKIEDVASPTVAKDAANKAYVDATAGDNLGNHTATQNLNLMVSYRIINVANPTGPQDAATKSYVDSQTGGGGDSDWVVSGNNVYTGTGAGCPSDNTGIGVSNPTAKLEISAPTAGVNGIKVTSPGQNGLWVYNPTVNGVYVENAGYHGLAVTNPSNHAILVEDVISSTSPYSYGMYLDDVEGSFASHGIFLDYIQGQAIHIDSGQAGGVYINYVGTHAFYAASPDQSGLFVGHSGEYGVYVQTSDEDSFYGDVIGSPGTYGLNTPDKIQCYEVVINTSGMVCRNNGSSALKEGDIVCIAGGYETVFLDDDDTKPVMNIRKAGEEDAGAIIGVVESKMVFKNLLKEEPYPQGPRSFYPDDGQIFSGDYVLIAVSGMAKVRVTASSGIKAGDRLTVSSTDGCARSIDERNNTANNYCIGKAVEESAGKDMIMVYVDCK